MRGQSTGVDSIQQASQIVRLQVEVSRGEFQSAVQASRLYTCRYDTLLAKNKSALDRPTHAKSCMIRVSRCVRESAEQYLMAEKQYASVQR